MNEHDVKQWACEWVGWLMDEDGLPYEHGDAEGPHGHSNSDADLAEAVRVKFIESEYAMAAGHNDDDCVWSDAAVECFQILGAFGPLAFMRAAMAALKEANK